MTIRPRLAILISGLALIIAGCGTEPEAVPAGRADQQALERIDADAKKLLDGGADAFRSRLASLRGHPVVVNQWASWCGPCQYESPFFERLARRYADRVAFLGVNSKDSRAGARRFLARHPVPFPHDLDPDGSVARVFRGGRTFPTTAFYNADGRLVATHSGAYASAAKLDDDIRRYALDG